MLGESQTFIISALQSADVRFGGIAKRQLVIKRKRCLGSGICTLQPAGITAIAYITHCIGQCHACGCSSMFWLLFQNRRKIFGCNIQTVVTIQLTQCRHAV
ncbi:hypothetical protein NM04_11810 [Massilia aurea]|uniref:Uncharacterized protein n=1 Tax=Massilia aurea TaxID=373040 RepID=A0A422QKP9_9BURK|nr:hypothetical protein NM04_11810 [Massilia aurea]